MKQAYTLITALIKDPEVDILQMLPKSKATVVTTSSWDKAVSTVAVSMHEDVRVGEKMYGNAKQLGQIFRLPGDYSNH